MPPLREVDRKLELLLRLFPERWSEATLLVGLLTARDPDGLEDHLDFVESCLRPLVRDR